jgi:hypothetical protein
MKKLQLRVSKRHKQTLDTNMDSAVRTHKQHDNHKNINIHSH